MDKQQKELKVLIVDGSDIIRSRLRSMLADLDFVRVVGTAENCDEAIELVERKAPDVVLLDINMPGKGGVYVLMEIKQSHSTIKVIMLTNHSEPHNRKRCAKAGSDYFFDKSTEFDLVPQVLGSLLKS
jgi:DNA-binding NarL/FixJ family response regulator